LRRQSSGDAGKLAVAAGGVLGHDNALRPHHFSERWPRSAQGQKPLDPERQLATAQHLRVRGGGEAVAAAAYC